MINWQEIAEQYRLTPGEFADQILAVAACVGAMEIDKVSGDAKLMRFTCNDDVGKIEVVIRRVVE